MKLSLSVLETEIESILSKAGFVSELYLIKKEGDCIVVLFDTKEAVDYFRGDFELSAISVDCMFNYKKDGKRHAAYIYSW